MSKIAMSLVITFLILCFFLSFVITENVFAAVSSSSTSTDVSAVKQQFEAAIARVEKSLGNNPNSAAMWLNAGAQLMKADDVTNVFELSQRPSSSSGNNNNLNNNVIEYHTILVENKKYNSEQALVKS